MYDYLLFDLDGTLTDPKEGITKCVQYALQFFDIEEPDLDKLEPFIGPPLKDSFMEFYGFDEEKAEEAIAKYRERFHETGIFENQLYPGIPQMLKKLKSKGKKLAVSSSKPTVFVERILEHFDIRQYFDVVVGSELDGTRVAKEEVVEEALRQLLEGREIGHEDAVIVGDRKFDVEGGRVHNLTTVAVSYGYGSMEELKEAKAEYIVRSVEELEKLLLRGTEDAKYEPPFNKMWAILFPVLIGYFVWQIGSTLGVYGTVTLAQMIPSLTDTLISLGADDMVYTTGIGSAVVNLFAFAVAGIVLYRMGREDIHRADAEAARVPKKKPGLYGYAVLATAGLSIGLNLLVNLLVKWISASSTVGALADAQSQRYEIPFLLAVLVYCIAASVAEEIMFRGIIYNRMKRYMGIGGAVFFSALIFAAYHVSQADVLTFVYALPMGFLIAYLYEKLGGFKVAVGVHLLANLCTYSLTYAGAFGGYMVNWAVCVICLLAGIVGVWKLKKSV